MIPVPTYLKHFEKVIDAFGYWPDFHDSPVLRFEAEPECVHLELEAWEMTPEVDSQGYFKLIKHHEIGFVFREIVDRDLDAFISGNILYELGFSSDEDRQAKGCFTVELDSVMGSDLCGRFSARSGEVTFVRVSLPPEAKGEEAE